LFHKASMPSVISRRALLRRLVSTSALGAASAGGAFGYGNLLERHWIQVIRRDVFLPNLPEEMDGFKIAQLSDLHLEPWTTAEDIADAVKLTNSLLPDLIVITGDFVTHTVKPAGRLAEVLAGLEAPHGVLGCMGNHDVWNQPSVLSHFMAERQIEILRNQGLRLHTPKGALFIAGLDSAWAGKPDVSPALRDWKPAEPLLILAHEPDTADHVARSSLPALQLSRLFRPSLFTFLFGVKNTAMVTIKSGSFSFTSIGVSAVLDCRSDLPALLK
jgi:hypothetical protein